MPTTYTLDTSASLSASLAADLSQVLSDGEFTYLYGLTRFAQQSATSTDYFPSPALRASLPDALGSVRQLYNQGGGIGLTQTFDPFGNLLSQEGSLSSRYGFAGEWADVTGLQHLRARYYAPIQGRFISKDPFPGKPGKPSTLNPYTYSYNNPILYTDPTGMWPDWFDYMMGAASQYADDVSFGVFSRIVGDLDYNRCYAFQSGRALGRNIAIVYASVEQVFGAFLLGASLASIGPTSGFSLAAALPSGGGSIAIGGVAVGVEVLGAVTGLGIAGLGTFMMAKINNDPLKRGTNGSSRSSNWKFGNHHSTIKWNNQMRERGWTINQIDEAIQYGEAFPAQNDVHPGNPATRFVHPTTGRSVVVDNFTNEILQIGGDEFLYQ